MSDAPGKPAGAAPRLEVGDTGLPRGHGVRVLRPSPLDRLPPGGHSAVLDRVKAFLPQLKSANEQLDIAIAAGGAAAVQVDNVPEGEEGPYIQMNLAVGEVDPDLVDIINNGEEGCDGESDEDNAMEGGAGASAAPSAAPAPSIVDLDTHDL